MGHGKETPRQKMIGMMYLVLTAMLALNVAKEVAEAFKIVDHKLVITTENFAAKNEDSYNEIAEQFALNENKTLKWKEKADQVRKLSDELYDFINECKVEIVIATDPDAIEEGHVNLEKVKKLDSWDKVGEVMIVNKKGDDLKDKIGEYREAMVEMVEEPEKNTGVIETIEGNLETKDAEPEKPGDEKVPWVDHNFDHMPLAAAVTILSSMQADIRNVESEVVIYLLRQIGATDYKVNKLDAIVKANASVVMVGQPYEAQIILAGFDSTKTPQVFLDDGTELEVENGMGLFSRTHNSEGDFTLSGKLQLDNGGQLIEKPFSAPYRVMPPSAVVSPTAMLVFYRGIPNPVKVTAAGVAPDLVSAEISPSGKMDFISPGKYDVWPGPAASGNECTINVYALVDGQKKLQGKAEFRVKPLPIPSAFVSGLPSSFKMRTSDLAKVKMVEAKAENFDFKVQYTIDSFDMKVTRAGGFIDRYPSTSNTLSNEMYQILSELRPNQIVIFDNIKCTGPDGATNVLNPLTITII